MAVCILLCLFLGFGAAQVELSPEERLPSIIDDLWQNIDKDVNNELNIIEFNAFFAAWDKDPVGADWALNETEFVAGWSPLFGHSQNEAVAFFQMFDWSTGFEFEAIVNSDDLDEIAVTIDFPLGLFMPESTFKSVLKSYMRGHCFSIVFNDYRTIGTTGYYDDFISISDWFERLGSDIDTDGNQQYSREEWVSHFTPRYMTEETAVRAFRFADQSASDVVEEAEWELLFYYMKLILVYPDVTQLHHEEWIQFEQLVLDTPRP